jgi:hypothetical protein
MSTKDSKPKEKKKKEPEKEQSVQQAPKVQIIPSIFN